MDDYEQELMMLGIQDLDDDVGRQMDADLDYAYALMLQSEENEVTKTREENRPSKETNLPRSIIDPNWDMIDPNPNIHSLFLEFNAEFFWGVLETVEVKWSPRMTLCAGVCSYEGRGGLCSVRLSQPLLKFRPRRDLVETLLHEMIHAYLFVTQNNKDRDGHGPEFLKHMNRINSQTGTTITVYHSFHNEVDYQRQHWWKCNGPCQYRKPYFGVVKRTMNRAPSSRDMWWKDHQQRCGGTFDKIKEPENYGQKKTSQKKAIQEQSDKSNTKDMKSFLVNGTSKGTKLSSSDKGNNASSTSHTKQGKSAVPAPPSTSKNNIIPFSGKGQRLGGTTPSVDSKSKKRAADGFFSNSANKRKVIGSVSSILSASGQSLATVSAIGIPSKNNLGDDFRLRIPDLNPAKLKSPARQATIDDCFKKSPAKKKICVLFDSDNEDDAIVIKTDRSGNPKAQSVPMDCTVSQKSEFISCPACNGKVTESEINNHLDNFCLSKNF